MTTITVLIATHNGADVLDDTLGGYARLDDANVDWNLIVVDNNSTDGTAGILARTSRTLPMQVLQCPRTGKNAALNAALPHLTGSFVIVSDDDAIPDRDFLQQWKKVADTRPDYGLFGATIEPHFRVPPPDWMMDCRFHFDELFARRELAEGEIRAVSIFGPNMAVRREIFEQGHAFNEAIGPNGSNANYPMGSETEFCERVEAAGFKAYFAAGPRVRHIVRKHQLTEQYWMRRAYKNGLGNGARHRLRHGDHRSVVERLRNAAKFNLTQLLRRLLIRASYSTLEKNIIAWELHWSKGYRDGVQSR